MRFCYAIIPPIGWGKSCDSGRIDLRVYGRLPQCILGRALAGANLTRLTRSGRSESPVRCECPDLRNTIDNILYGSISMVTPY